jgi:hypothetical protein
MTFHRRYYHWLAELRKAWKHINHAKAARWTVGVHIVYYVHAATDAHGLHIATAVACASVLMLEFFSKDD